MKIFAGLTCLLGLLVAVAVTNAAEEKPKQPQPQVAKKINSVEFETTQGDKPQFIVTATTTVPTGGYKAELRRVTYVMQPLDGIQDYTLYLTKPDGIATQAFTDVKASDSWPVESAGWLKGVRVHGEGKGIVVKMIEKGK